MVIFRMLKLRPLAILVDACIVVNAYTLASLVLFARWAPLQYYEELLVFLPIAVIIHCAVNYRLGLYRGVGRYAGLHRAIRLSYAALITMPLLFLAGLLAMPDSWLHVLAMVPIGGCIAYLLMAVVRFYPRVFYERSLREVEAGLRLLVVGAGAASEMIVRSFQKERNLGIEVVALVDDNPELEGLEIHGVNIYCPTESIAELVREKDVDEILIAIPSATLDQFQRIWQICSRTGIVTKTVRPLQSTHLGEVGVSHIRDIEIEDVLGRQPVQTDYTGIRDFIMGKTVLITGAGGSIGSELSVQISHHNPARMVLVDRDESALYQIHERLSHNLFHGHELCVADVCAEDSMDLLFKRHRPDLVFHAAAYKHVPLMEQHPDEAVLNNVMGTWIVASLAGAYGAGCFVNISTDKAVSPVNVMGATKNLSERLVQEIGELNGNTRFCSVRFGNVLGSRGSVIPIFREQIRRGGPITITHPDMTRYFMLISEAVDLVLQAAAFQEDDSIYVLEMGQPVRIVDLANQMISFMRPEEPIDTVFTGLRPGEKIHEQLIDSYEAREASGHPMIYRVMPPRMMRQPVLEKTPHLIEKARSRDFIAISACLKEMIGSYKMLDPSIATESGPFSRCFLPADQPAPSVVGREDLN